jgi:DNA-binding response OmpR family regulator
MSARQGTKGTLKPLTMMVGGPASDYALLQEICEKSGWGLCRARNRRDTARILQTGRVEVVISDRDLPQGNWRDLLRDLSNVQHPPALVVTSRMADEALWAEVLNMGGYDVLAQPLDSEEVTRVIGAALRRMGNEREHESRRAHPPLMSAAN